MTENRMYVKRGVVQNFENNDNDFKNYDASGRHRCN